MTKYFVFDNGVFSCEYSFPDDYDPSEFFNDKCAIKSDDYEKNGNCYYFDNGSIIEKQNLNVVVNGSHISDIPIDSKVFIDGEVFYCNDGYINLTSQYPQKKTVAIENKKYNTLVLEVNCGN